MLATGRKRIFKDMHFTLLADRPEAIPQIAAWYFDQWGYLWNDTGLGDVESRLQGSLNQAELPLLILAIENEEIIGVAELTIREMDIYPEKEHWLGGVYVPEESRGKGIGSELSQQVLQTARSLGISTLFLQTEMLDGGLYASLGWATVEQVNYHGYERLVMKKNLHDQTPDRTNTANES